MAKFKKKISEPTIGPNDSKKDSVEVSTPTPEIENSESVSNNSSGEPPVSVAEKSEKDKKLNTLFWMRIALAIIAGTAATFLFEGIEGEDRRWASIGFMIVVFFGSVIVAKGMKMQLPSSDRKKVVTQAIGSYVFLYLFSWIVSWTLIHLGSTSNAINI
ncbi:MAG: hypothetical protein OPY06_02185 [Nitrosopumilus sp.]|nr:hypothetical protein [Nitrosopumilus sp.]MDF2423316.1 hypothetical protein [Nitrosopumilus sp.]MDF2424526.1 hypothetical protein [Nitrosopumilus sp.]MDF2425229.1 hypothetical protein [Nitrosopumilus sp.]MDF2426905.1 hypothetical protein [Nitrosopumilus sp.]